MWYGVFHLFVLVRKANRGHKRSSLRIKEAIDKILSGYGGRIEQHQRKRQLIRDPVSIVRLQKGSGDYIERLEQASDPEQEGVRICAELLQELAEIPGVSGANLMTPGDPATIAAAISASGLRPDLVA